MRYDKRKKGVVYFVYEIYPERGGWGYTMCL